MKIFNGKFRAQEQLESDFKGKNYRTGISKKNANKCFRQTGRNLKLYDPDTIYAPNYKQRHGWEL